MLKRGFEIGLSNGDAQTALICWLHYIQKSLISGMNLSYLKSECDYQMRLLDDSQQMSKLYMSGLQESIARLIAKQPPSPEINQPDEDDAIEFKEFSEATTFYCVLQSFWLGHYDRCLYHAERSSASSGEWGKFVNCYELEYPFSSHLLPITNPVQRFRYQQAEGHHDNILWRAFLLPFEQKVQDQQKAYENCKKR